MRKILIAVLSCIIFTSMLTGQKNDSINVYKLNNAYEESIQYQILNYELQKENIELRNRLLVNRYQTILFPVLLILGIFTSFFMASIFFRNQNGKLLQEIEHFKRKLDQRQNELESSRRVLTEISSKSIDL